MIQPQRVKGALTTGRQLGGVFFPRTPTIPSLLRPGLLAGPFFCGAPAFSKGRPPLREAAGQRIAPASRALIRGSSVVEQPAVNRLVVGSNPTRGATS